MGSPRPLIAWLWTALVFVLCWTPRQFVPEGERSSTPFLIPYLDKVVHFLLFAGFAFCWLAAGRLRARGVVVAGVVAAGLSELGQMAPFVHRDANWPDGFADVLGVAAGVAAYYLARPRYPRLAAPQPRVRVPSAETP